MTERLTVTAATRTRQSVRAVLAAGVILALAAGPARPADAAGHPAVDAVLSAVSCKGPSFCLAIGHYSKPGHPEVQLTEMWNGKTWRIVSDPLRGFMTHLTCGGPSFCLASRFIQTETGISPQPMAVWNGRTWKVFKDQPTDPNDVVCVSAAFCASFNSFPAEFHATTVQAWTGNGWKDMPGSDFCTGGPACSWDALICGSATNCNANGLVCDSEDCTSEGPILQTWNGRAWNQFASAPITGAQACAGTAFCMITEPPATAMFTRDWYNTWHDASPDLAQVCHGLANCSLGGAFACGSAWSCLELQTGPQPQPGHRSASLAWNGTTWTAAQVARAHGQIPTMTSLSCGRPGNCVAIGSYQPSPSSHPQPMAEHWNGTAWQFTPITLP